MPKLYSGRRTIKALERMGFGFVSQKGSHVKVRRIYRGKVYTAVVPLHKEVAIGTLQSILKQAGTTREELEENIK